MSYSDTIPSKNYYHDFLIKSMKYYNISLNNGKEFWTLGAQKWHEYDQLIELGIDFTDGLYCNVDRGTIDHPGTRKNCIAYPNREFNTIWEVWNKPYIISYDSVHGAVKSNRNLWNGVCGLATAAAKKDHIVPLRSQYDVWILRTRRQLLGLNPKPRSSSERNTMLD